jgi:hypothetical protein
VKTADISRKKEGISERKINELATTSKNKNIREVHRGINKFRRIADLEITW